MANLDNILLREGLRELQRRLPPGWSVSKPLPNPTPVGAVAHLTASNGSVGPIALEVRVRLDPRGVVSFAEAARAAPAGTPLVLVARYLSAATRASLREREIGYLDLTGNARIVVPEPGLFLEAQGAAEDPNRKERPTRSLRGAKAGRIVRALVDRKLPPGVRELAARIDTDAGYVSRVFAFLDSEALVTRVQRGRLESVDWPALLRRWAQDAPIESRGGARTYLDPRGLSAFVERLTKSSERYAITGGLAAAALAPAASPRLATVWIRDASEAAKRLGLRSAEAGANVLLLEPSDDSVFDGAQERDGATCAAPSQVVADLLTSPGRGPSEGEGLLDWMLANEKVWRQ